jgi:hypothetical protein
MYRRPCRVGGFGVADVAAFGARRFRLTHCRLRDEGLVVITGRGAFVKARDPQGE